MLLLGVHLFIIQFLKNAEEEYISQVMSYDIKPIVMFNTIVSS